MSKVKIDKLPPLALRQFKLFCTLFYFVCSVCCVYFIYSGILVCSLFSAYYLNFIHIVCSFICFNLFIECIWAKLLFSLAIYNNSFIFSSREVEIFFVASDFSLIKLNLRLIWLMLDFFKDLKYVLICWLLRSVYFFIK